MISPRYSNDRVDANDLKRSFINILPCSVVAFLALIMFHVQPVLSYVFSESFKTEKMQKDVLFYFLDSNNVFPSFIQIGMVLCGMLMAFSLFQFLLKKKSVNVYLSFGMTRSKLYINRLFAAVLSLFVATFIPTFLTFIINLVSFGASSALTSLFCYMFLMEFVSGLAGFALASAVMTFSGCTIEAVITAIGLSALPTFISGTIDNLSTIVRGYVYNAGADIARRTGGNLFNIWTFALDTENLNGKATEFTSEKTFVLLGQLTKKSTFKAFQCVDMEVLAPILMWLAISIILIGIGTVFMNKRKSENSNSFGKFYLASASNGLLVYTIVLDVLASVLKYAYAYNYRSPLHQNLTLILLILFGATILAFFLAELILRRNFKATLKTLPVYALAFAVTIFAFVYYGTSYFGAYNKLPDISQVKSVSMDIKDNRGTTLQNTAINSKFLSENAEDIKTAYAMFDMVKADKHYKGAELEGKIGFKIVLKDGTEINRIYAVYTSDVYNKYRRTVYNTQFFKDFLKQVLIEGKVTSEDDSYIDENGYQTMASNALPNTKNVEWFYVGPSYLVDNYYTNSATANLDIIEDVNGLKEAIYKDYIAMSYDDAYTNTRIPVGAISSNITQAKNVNEKLINNYGYYYEESNIYGYDDHKTTQQNEDKCVKGSAIYSFYIYPNMTNTIKFLNDNGLTPLAYTGNIKEVYYADTNYSVSRVLSHYADGSKLDNRYEAFDFSQALNVNNYGAVADGAPDTISFMDFVKNAYVNAGLTLKTVSGDKAKEIVSKAIPYYEPDHGTEIKGRYIMIVYDDNTITSLYVPEGNMAVFG
jgi:hypothetical protein